MKMTKQKSIDFLSSTKVYLNGQSEKIRNILYSLGFKESKPCKDWIKMPFMYIHENLTFEFFNNMQQFIEDEYTEINVYKILEIEISMYDFKCGDPVLGVDGCNRYRFDIFSHRMEGNYNNGCLYVCTGRSYNKCIPFKGNEELVGTLCKD